mmetsp:Transcript_36793/g.81840  ORF Transcript_36793/g.81840 Transcript_36793/m.81840 type:complete len:216 (+) Transcript_36793:408-1055(+)
MNQASRQPATSPVSSPTQLVKVSALLTSSRAWNTASRVPPRARNALPSRDTVPVNSRRPSRTSTLPTSSWEPLSAGGCLASCTRYSNFQFLTSCAMSAPTMPAIAGKAPCVTGRSPAMASATDADMLASRNTAVKAAYPISDSSSADRVTRAKRVTNSCRGPSCTKLHVRNLYTSSLAATAMWSFARRASTGSVAPSGPCMLLTRRNTAYTAIWR